MSLIEAIAVVFALVYVVFAMRESVWCWPAAIISALLYIKIFVDAELYTEAGLQLFFIALAIQGIARWRKREGEEAPKAVIRVESSWYHITRIVAVILIGIALGSVVKKATGASFAHLDSLITVFSIYTTYLVTEKILENWLYWIAIDVVAAGLYFVKELYLTSGLFALYVVLAAMGYAQWKSRMEQQDG